MEKITAEMVRAARQLLRWDQAALAEASALGLATIKRLELQYGAIDANLSTVAAVRRALEDAGILFLENGVQFVGDTTQTIALDDLNASNDE
jgi:hypothetical protein